MATDCWLDAAAILVLSNRQDPRLTKHGVMAVVMWKGNQCQPKDQRLLRHPYT